MDLFILDFHGDIIGGSDLRDAALEVEFDLFLLGFLHFRADVLHLNCRIFDDVLGGQVRTWGFAGLISLVFSF
jgi:hypothetical protein